MQRTIALASLLVVGCGASVRDDDETATLQVTPATSELWIRNGVPATASFTATLTNANGESRDVTNEVQFSIDAGFGSFTANQLTLRGAGKTLVLAALDDKVAQAEVIGHVDTVRVDPSLPPGAAGWFEQGTEDPARAPTIVYPPADVVMPRNIGAFEVHWMNTQNNVFEVSLRTDYANVRVIVPGGNGTLANSSWLAFLAQEWFAAVGHESSLLFQVRGVNMANPAVIGSTAPRLVKLSNEELLGGLYYWAATAANGPYGIFRHDMGKPGEPAEQFMTTAQTNGRCVACHVLSRDGSKMAVTYDGGNGAATIVDVATKVAQPSRRGWNFGSFTPDGSKFLAIQHGQLTVIQSATQATVATMTSAGLVSQADLSPTGNELVYTRPATTTEDYLVSNGKIFIRTFNPATNAFGPERPLVADTSNNYYPSFSPDGTWVLFTRAASGTSYNNANASLWVIKADGSGPPIQLVKGNAAGGLTNSWGRWAPFAQTVGANSEPIYWVTVSSKRNFGVRMTSANRPQIWMTPFYAQRAAANMDPSAPAFWLPFQSLTSNNHIAQWTEQVVVIL